MKEKTKTLPVMCTGSGRSWPGIGWFSTGEVRQVPSDLRPIMVKTGYFAIPKEGHAPRADDVGGSSKKEK